MVEITKKYLLRQGLWIYLFTFLAAPLGYLIRILYARSFSVEEFGLIYSIIGFIALVSVFNDLGFTESLNYYITRFYEKKKYKEVKGSFLFALIMQGVTAIILGILFWIISPWLSENYFRLPQALWVFRGFILYFIFFNVSKPLIQLFISTHNYLFNAMAEFVRQFIIIIISCLIIFFDKLHNIIFISIIWGLAYFILFLGFYWLIYRYYPQIFNIKADLSIKLYNKLWNYAIIVVWGVGASIVLSRIDIIMITYFLDLIQVAYYSIAYSTASLITVLVTPILAVFFPLSSKLFVNKDNKSIENIISTMYTKGFFIIIPILTIICSFSKEIIIILYGKEYISANIILVILSIAFFFIFIQNFNFNILSGIGMYKQKTVILIIGTIINIILNLIFINKFQLKGVAWATLVSAFIMVMLSFYFLRKKLRLNIKIKNTFNILLVNVLGFFIILSLKYLIKTNIYLEAIIIGLIMFMFYLYLYKVVIKN